MGHREVPFEASCPPKRLCEVSARFLYAWEEIEREDASRKRSMVVVVKEEEKLKEEGMQSSKMVFSENASTLVFFFCSNDARSPSSAAASGAGVDGCTGDEVLRCCRCELVLLLQ